MKKPHRTLSMLLATVTCAAGFTACTTVPSSGPLTTTAPSENTDTVVESATEHEAETPFVGLRFDATTRIVVPADAHEIIRNAADMVASAVKEKAGMTLSVIEANADGGADGPALVLAIRSFETERSYALTAEEQALRLEASDPTTLYFATQAVLDAWLTPDFGLATEGVLSLDESRVAELNGLTTEQDTSIKVLSQNMRYTSDPDGNSIGQRNQRFQRLVMEYRPDLIGMQEVTAEWLQHLKRLTQGVNRLGGDAPEYGMVTCFREGPDVSDGEAQTILYSLERFEHLDSGVIWLSETPDIPSMVEDSSYNCVLTWALLKDKQTDETILYANTHLEYRFAKEHIRVAQMEYILDFLEEYKDKYTVYVSGDFNFRPDSTPYLVATEALKDSYNTTWENLSTVNYTYHDYEREPDKTKLDHIFHNDQTTPIRYEIISKLYDGFVSDHYGVIVEFINEN